MELSVCLSPLIHGELGRSSHRPASPCPAGGGSAGIRLYSQAKRCDAHHTEPPEEGTDTGGEHKPESSAEVWQAGSEGDQKVTHPSHTFFFEIWRGGKGGEPTPSRASSSSGVQGCSQPAPQRLRTGGHGGPPAPPQPEGGRARRRRKEGGQGRRRRGAGCRRLLSAALQRRHLPAPRACGGARPAPTTAPRAPPSRGATAPAGGELRPPPRTPAPPPPAARPSSVGTHRLRSPAALPSRGDAPAARLLAPSPRPIGGCRGAARLQRACSWGKLPFPSPKAEPLPLPYVRSSVRGPLPAAGRS